MEIITIKNILTQEEADDLFTIPDEQTEKPDFFDDNSDEWVAWLYKNRFRIVQLPE